MTSELDYIKYNLEEIMGRIKSAAERSGRNPGDIRLIAVTKTIDTDRISRVIEEGICDLGENRVQELTQKYDIIKGGCNWHLIGHLQTNKVKYILDKVSLIHSVDRLELAEEISKRAVNKGIEIKVLVQVNVAEEESKFGTGAGEAKELVKNIGKLPNIRVKGLMTIAPFTQDQEEVRWVFKELNKLFIDIKKENIDNIDMEFLSMGMSNDFEVAIEEGANMVRVGTAIFGKRQY